MVIDSAEQRGRNLGTAEYLGPLAEAEVGGDDNAGAQLELARQVEQRRAARGADRQVAKFIEDDENRGAPTHRQD